MELTVFEENAGRAQVMVGRHINVTEKCCRCLTDYGPIC